MSRVQAHAKEVCGRDDESVAIDACVKALDVMSPRSTSTYYSPPPLGSTAPSARRVLDYLHERYVGPRPSEADLTRQLAEAHDRIRTLSTQLDSVRCTLGPL